MSHPTLENRALPDLWLSPRSSSFCRHSMCRTTVVLKRRRQGTRLLLKPSCFSDQESSWWRGSEGLLHSLSPETHDSCGTWSPSGNFQFGVGGATLPGLLPFSFAISSLTSSWRGENNSYLDFSNSICCFIVMIALFQLCLILKCHYKHMKLLYSTTSTTDLSRSSARSVETVSSFPRSQSMDFAAPPIWELLTGDARGMVSHQDILYVTHGLTTPFQSLCWIRIACHHWVSCSVGWFSSCTTKFRCCPLQFFPREKIYPAQLP